MIQSRQPGLRTPFYYIKYEKKSRIFMLGWDETS